MKRLFSTAVLSLTLLSPTAGHAGALDILSNPLDLADKNLTAVTGQQADSSLTQLNYSEPMGFSGIIPSGGDECFVTINKDRVHVLTYVGDGEYALLFKLTKKNPDSFTATCMADVSYNMWHKKHPKGGISGKLSKGKLILSFSNANVTPYGNQQAPITLTRAKDGVQEFVQQRKQFFESDAKMSTDVLSWESMIKDKQLADYGIVTLFGEFIKRPDNDGMAFHLEHAGALEGSSDARKLAKEDPYYLRDVIIMKRYDEFRSLQAPKLEKLAKSLKLENGNFIAVTGRLGKFALQGDDALIFYGDSPITIDILIK